MGRRAKMSADTSRVLVCYASGTGCTQGVAERIGETLAGAGLGVDVRPIDSSPDPTGYDAIVAGSGTRAGGWMPVAKKWTTRNAAVLSAKPLAIFTVGIAMAHGADRTGETLGAADRLLEQAGLEPLDIGAFAGWYVPSKFTLIERKIMQIAKAPEGDFRDWTAIEEWAKSLAPKLGSAGSSSAA
jgi:menaquinone-dependent protoporphyrinogen oxidase